MHIRLDKIQLPNISFDSPYWGFIRVGIFLIALLVFIIVGVLLYPQTELPGIGLRCVLSPVFICLGVFYTGAKTIKTAYGLKSIRQAFFYLLKVFGGIQYPKLKVRDGKMAIKEGEDNLLDKIGGPGYLDIAPGNVVVIENIKGFPEVIGAGNHFISRLKMIKEVVSLEERSGVVDLYTMTKDGIPFEIKAVRYRYRICAEDSLSSRNQGVYADVYSYDEAAVLRMVYHRSFDEVGVNTWDDTVKRVLSSAITGYISEHTVDQLTAAEEYEPRKELYARLQGEKIRQRLYEVGADLIWIDIGHFGVADEMVNAQRVNAWQTRWEGDVSLQRALGEAERLAHRELGRAKAQAAILKNIAEALGEVAPRAKPGEHIQKIIIARLASLLDAMREQTHFPNIEENSQTTE